MDQEETMETSRRGIPACLAALALAVLSAAAWASAPQVLPHWSVVSDGHNRIADPKLSGGGVRASFHLSGVAGQTLAARADVYGPLGYIKTLWSGTLVAGAPPTTVGWDGKDASSLYVSTGEYSLLIVGPTGS